MNKEIPTAEEILKKYHITINTKNHSYVYTFNSTVIAMQKYCKLHLSKQAEVISEKQKEHFNKIEVILKELEEKMMDGKITIEENNLWHKLMLLPNDKQSIINASEEYKNNVK